MVDTQGPAGLSAGEVAARRAQDGWNELAADRSHSLFDTVLEVVREPMFLLLLGAGASICCSAITHEALVLLGFVVVIIGSPSLQERRTETALAALRDLSSPRALVLRDGAVQRVAGREVVRGDILLLNEGDRVPADGVRAVVARPGPRRIDAHRRVGAVPKLRAGDAPPPQVFAGTLVVSGQGTGEVDRDRQRHRARPHRHSRCVRSAAGRRRCRRELGRLASAWR
jgi:Ca2+-transporting ATPase